jgi:hypothetical protein
MAARGNITLTDAAGTPVAHVFKPASGGSNGAQIGWRDSTTSIYAGQAVLTVVQRLADKKTKTTKVTWKLETPVLAQTSPSTSTGIQPAPSVAYTPLATFDFVLPDQMSLQERKDLQAMIRDLIDEAIVTSQVQDLEMIF